jgi:hypothetical protein
VNSRVLGVVLNAVDSSSPDYYYSYRCYPYAYGADRLDKPEKSKNGAGASNLDA